MRSIRKIVVLGANGAMGSVSGAVFAAAGIPTTFLARTLNKAEAGRTRAHQSTKGTISPHTITCGTYATLEEALSGADLVFEAVCEDAAVKRRLFARIGCAGPIPSWPLDPRGCRSAVCARIPA